MTKTQQTPPSAAHTQFLNHIAYLCTKHNASVTSWIRTPTRNRLKGGHPNSQHLTGTAIDLVLDNAKDIQPLIHDAIKLGLIPIQEFNHIHIQLYKRKP